LETNPSIFFSPGPFLLILGFYDFGALFQLFFPKGAAGTEIWLSSFLGIFPFFGPLLVSG